MKYKGVLSGQFYYHFSDPTEDRAGDDVMHEVTASTTTPEGKPDKVIGRMSWSPAHKEYREDYGYTERQGEISDLNVDEEFQRRGVATKMFHLARKVAAADPRFSSIPEHSPVLTPEGAMWARSTGTWMPDPNYDESGEYKI